MQAFEQRADEMLRTMGGSLTIQAQRIVLRRLIEAEDKVTDLQQQADLAARAFKKTASMAADEAIIRKEHCLLAIRCAELHAENERLRKVLQQIVHLADPSEPRSAQAADLARGALWEA